MYRAREVIWRVTVPAFTLALAVAAVAAGTVSPARATEVKDSATPAAIVDGLSASSGSLTGGEDITITGANLGTATRVTFGGQDAPSVTVLDTSTLSVIVPHSALYTPGVVPVVVLDRDGHAALTTEPMFYSYEVLTDVDRQLQYAFEYWNDYNLDEYGDFTPWGGDCMDFVSQTLVARGWTTTDDWFNDAQQSWAPAFVDVPYFDAWLRDHPEIGAVQLSLAQRDQAKIGDIVVFDWDGDGSLDHAMIVSGIEHVDGQTKILLVGHDINSQYRDLDTALATEGQSGATAYIWSLPAS
jgi:hypothetical protein